MQQRKLEKYWWRHGVQMLRVVAINMNNPLAGWALLNQTIPE